MTNPVRKRSQSLDYQESRPSERPRRLSDSGLQGRGVSLATEAEASIPSLTGVFDASVNSLTGEFEAPVEVSPGDDIVAVDVPVGSLPKKGSLSHRVGLTGTSRQLSIEEEADQTKLDKLLGEFALIIGTDNPFDLHIDLDEKDEPIIHTVTVYEKDAEGNHSIPKRYDLLHGSELVRLRGVEGPDQSRLKELAKEFDELINKVVPHHGKRPKVSVSSMGNLNGPHAFSEIAPTLHRLFDDSQLEQTLKSAFAQAGLIDDSGKLTSNGKKAMKEIAAMHYFVSEEKTRLSNKRSESEEHMREIIQRASYDPTQHSEEVKRYEDQIAAYDREMSQYEEASQFATAWMIIQLHQNMDRTLYAENGDEIKTPNEAFDHEGALYVDPEQKQEIDLGRLREVLAAKSKERFARLASVVTNGWVNRTLLRSSDRRLSNTEMESGFALGTLFFPQRGDADARLRTQLHHERHRQIYTQEIPGVRKLLCAARAASSESSDIPREIHEDSFNAAKESVKELQFEGKGIISQILGSPEQDSLITRMGNTFKRILPSRG